MNRYLRILSVVLVMALLFVGCTKAEVSPTEPTTEASPEPSGQLSGPLSLGDKMPELTVTTPEGETLVLSELLQEKKLVVLNFWFADCIWCVREFPVMEVSYQQYRQDVEILALNPYDAPNVISTFRQEHSLSMPMASCSQDLTRVLGVNAYPTSVVIDRDGTICMIHAGAITQKEVFDQLFDTFTAEDYTARVYRSINDLF